LGVKFSHGLLQNEERAVVIVEYGLVAPAKLDFYIEAMARATGISSIIITVREYLGSWPKERIASAQKIDGGWAPFDGFQRPRSVNSAATVHCIRDSIHAHCMALREAGMALTPELVELDEFFYAASKMLEKYGEAALQWRSGPDRMPMVPSHAAALVNW
jgi:hypothetical protein